jgi:hypothetical protein
MISTNGIEITIDGRKRSHVDVATVRRSIALMLKEMNVPAHLAGQILGVHRNTILAMTSAKSKAPKPLGVIFGSGEWTPECQDQDMATCNRCGGNNGSVKRGSRLYCAACHRTGFEKQLENERIDDIFEQAVSAEVEAQERKATLAQRRKNRKK